MDAACLPVPLASSAAVEMIVERGAVILTAPAVDDEARRAEHGGPGQTAWCNPCVLPEGEAIIAVLI